MQVILSKYSGACYGVQRALSMAEQTIASEDTVSSLGQLIHNPQVVAQLERKGLKVAHCVGEAKTGALIIRSHGVSPDVMAAAKDRGLKLVDATCPHVTKAQQAASDLNKRGYDVIVVGERDHPEVKAICAWAKDRVFIVENANDVLSIADALVKEKVGVVVQTTQTPQVLQTVVDSLRKLGIDPKVSNTLCTATKLRQEAALDLAKTVDVMIVVGGKNSSNTSRLAEISASVCPATYHVEASEEIDQAWFRGARRIGITAGASTPKSQIESIVESLNELV